VTIGPGLAGSLLVGVNIAKAIALAQGLPLLGINHLEGHIYANWLEGSTPHLPTICLIVSGGHSDLLLMKQHGDYQPLGRTRDDAAGEAFDKVARILDLGYPGGPAIEQAAGKGNSARYRLPRAWLQDSDDFSFSGLKTAVLRLAAEPETPSSADIAASFQEAVVDVLVTKTVAAAKRLGAQQILLCGGVAANNLLRHVIAKRSPIPILIPSPILCTDNAAMIASCGYFHLTASKHSGWELDIAPNLRLE
jgi:N6-L-threonylcarbamoyladenine synthase